MEWPVGNVFCNPPISATTKDRNYQWVKRCAEHAQQGKGVAVLLIAARTDVEWFHSFVWNHNRPHDNVEVRFSKGRIKFRHPDDPTKDAPPFGSLIAIFRPPAGMTYNAEAASKSIDLEKVNPHPNRLYASLTDYAFPERP